jgi:hypothetical protein
MKICSRQAPNKYIKSAVIETRGVELVDAKGLSLFYFS